VYATGSGATPVVVVNNVGWGVLYDVRVLYLAGLLELNIRVLYLVTGTSPGYLPLLFSYSVYKGCLRSHCGISKSQMVNLIPTCIVSNQKNHPAVFILSVPMH